jgi:5-methylcytosine-specific restriction endonuclease McrA
VNRQQAIACSLSRYFTGKPCVHGHISERYTKTRICVECCRTTNSKQPQSEKRLRRRKWLAANADRNRQQSNKSRLNNLEKARAGVRRYHRENPHVGQAAGANRRAKLKMAGGSFKPREVTEMLLSQNKQCANCSISIEFGYHIDHIMPIALGGSNHITNIQLLCAPCNRRKHAKHPSQWAAENGRDA